MKQENFPQLASFLLVLSPHGALLTKCEAGYWSSSFLVFLWTKTKLSPKECQVYFCKPRCIYTGFSSRNLLIYLSFHSISCGSVNISIDHKPKITRNLMQFGYYLVP